MAGAATATLALIYHVTVYNIRKRNRNPIMGIIVDIARSVVLIVGFLLMYWMIGVRQSPVRGDFGLYVMSGIFLYITNITAVGAVAGAGGASSALLKHEPITTAVLITSAALAALYRSVFAAMVIAGAYYLYQPYVIDKPLGAMAMLLLAWFSGCAVGMLFLSLRPWNPSLVEILTQIYSRANMIASGKMFLANALPPFVLVFFDWNPLFHIIDQARGYTFINYTPHNSSLTYPIVVTLSLLMVGLMAEFVTRRSVSLSWSAGR